MKSEQAIQDLHNLLGTPPKEFVEKMCLEIMEDFDLTRVNLYVLVFGKLQMTLDQCHNEVLNLKGTGAEWRCIYKRVKQICTIVNWVDNILCYVIMDKDQLIENYHLWWLMYQT